MVRNRTAVAAVVLALTVGCDDKASAPPIASSSTSASAAAAPPPAPSSTALASGAPSAAPTAPPTEIAAQHVLVAYKGAKRAPSNVTRSKADAKTRAEEVVEKARAGEDFTALVKTYSDDPEAQSRLGSLGKFGRDKMDKTFSDAAFALKVGETSAVVETPFGFHVIKRNQ